MAIRKKAAVAADKKIKALHPGKRISKSGNTYYESRPNRSDIDRRKKYGKGGGLWEDDRTTLSEEEKQFIREESQESGQGYTYRAKILFGDHVIIKEKNNSPIQKWRVDNSEIARKIAEKLNKANDNNKKPAPRITRAQKQYMKDVDAYKWFVVDLKNNKAVSGWEFKTDATEALSDYDGDKNFKVLSEKTLKLLGIQNPKETWKMENGGNVSLTNQQVFDKGEVIDLWPSDAGGSNMSEDNVIELNGINYLVTIDMETGEVLRPNAKATVWVDEYALGGFVAGVATGAIGTLAVQKALSPSKNSKATPKNELKKYRVTYFVENTPTEKAEYFSTKAKALSKYMQLIKSNSHVSLDKRKEGTVNDWDTLKYNKGISKILFAKGGSVKNMNDILQMPDDKVLEEFNTIFYYDLHDNDEYPFTDAKKARKELIKHYKEVNQDFDVLPFNKGGNVVNSEIEQEIAEYEALIADPSVPKDEKDFAKEEIAELKKQLESKKSSVSKPVVSKKATAKKAAPKKSAKKTKAPKIAKPKNSEKGRIMVLAKELHKEGKTTWAQSLKKAGEMLRNKKGEPVVIKPTRIQTGTSNDKADKARVAEKPGKRISKSGRIYYENRKNRSDI